MTLTAVPLALRKLVEADLGVVERGLGLVDHHFSLGASAVGVMALDATGSLTLIAVDLNADDELFRGAAGARTAGVADIRTSSSASSQARGSGPISRRDCSCRRPAERLASGYSQRISTFTLGYSGGFPSTSTIRMLPSGAWSSRLLLL